MRDGSAVALLHVGGHPTLEISRDLWADWRRAMARLASILLHLLVLGLLFIHWPEPKHEVEPSEIPVEIVMEPPRLKVEPAPMPAPRSLHGESGDDSNLAPGRPAESPIPQPAKEMAKAKKTPQLAAKQPPVPKQEPTPSSAPQSAETPNASEPSHPAKAEPTASAQRAAQAVEATKTPATTPAEIPAEPVPLPQAASVTPWPIPAPKPPQPIEKAPPLVAASTPTLATSSSSALAKTPTPIPKPAAPVDKTPPQIASLPPDRALSPSQPESRLRGLGGGDPYLNAMRDDIVSNIIYPRAANGSAGMARYVLTINRQGFLLELYLLQTSGSTALDRAGWDAIQNTAPFRPLPPRIPGNAIRIEALLFIAPRAK